MQSSKTEDKKDNSKRVRRMMEACLTAAACTYLGITAYRKLTEPKS
jgi:hypothetical protein